MNISEYISSGALEAYALDQLPEVERGEVEALLLKHPELSEEMTQIELAIESLAFETAVAPPLPVQQQILSVVSNREAPVIAMSGNESGSLMKYVVAASITVALVSSFLAFNYWNKWKLSEIQLSALVAQNQQYADNYNQVNQELDNIQSDVAIMSDLSYSKVVLDATDGAPGSLATIYWNKSTQEVFLNIQQLKVLAEDQQYQLWAIMDGKPVDAGVFDLDNSRLLVPMKNVSSAAAFAVTIEPKGGSASPTLAAMQVLGNV